MDTGNVDKDFCEWLCGFTDGDGSFMIMKNGSKHISFRFALNLHVYDARALEFITAKLGMGKVYSYGHSSSLIIKNIKEIDSIIKIFPKYPPKTHQYLNWRDLAKAYQLYSLSKIKTPELVEEILYIKSKMNLARTNLESPLNVAMSEDKAIQISPKLLGVWWKRKVVFR